MPLGPVPRHRTEKKTHNVGPAIDDECTGLERQVLTSCNVKIRKNGATS
jgi:hypothetical protein